MFHKNVLPISLTAPLSASPQQLPHAPQDSTRRLVLLPARGATRPASKPSLLFDLIAVAAPRCSSFFAEAAVLVLVLAVLDRFMSKGHMEIDWAVGAVAISLLLLAASITTDLASRRWLQQH